MSWDGLRIRLTPNVQSLVPAGQSHCQNSRAEANRPCLIEEPTKVKAAQIPCRYKYQTGLVYPDLQIETES